MEEDTKIDTGTLFSNTNSSSYWLPIHNDLEACNRGKVKANKTFNFIETSLETSSEMY